MYSLSYVLTDQHGDELAPFRCNAQTVSRLIRYFEDIVTENRLSALVIEGRCLDGELYRETERLTTLSSAARHLYLFSCDPSCQRRTWTPEKSANITELEEKEYHSIETGPFILVMDQRFTGLLASYRIGEEEPHSKTPYELIWTFDSNVVFTGIEYLMARIGVQKPWERSRLESLLNSCTPHSSSIRLSLAFTTKLAMLLHRQNELETAINSISSAISSTLELEPILQSAVEEVGRALKARRAALVLWEEQTRRPESLNVYEREDDAVALAPESAPGSGGSTRSASIAADGTDSAVAGGSAGSAVARTDTRAGSVNGAAKKQPSTNSTSLSEAVIPGPIEVPITYRESIIGVLAVEDDTPGRVWESEETLMVRTVSDQLAVAISH
ncbi:MAG: GAF domain-containing protein, partial [Blastocatellia bacterium]